MPLCKIHIFRINAKSFFRFGLLLVLQLLTYKNILCAQSAENIHVRGAWLTTLNNIDWPSKPGLTTAQMKSEIDHILQVYNELTINTIYFQVRPSADAFYRSEYEPWSKFLTGETGKAPEADFDPLAYLITEAHKRCMEVHAWINPFRVLLNSSKAERNDFIKKHRNPNWIITYGNQVYYDPGLKEVQDYTLAVIKDIVENYDVNGIHFDDYFYPYPKGKLTFADDATYVQANSGLSHSAWRRENINTFIKKVHEYMQTNQPYKKFGVSPFGVWENASKSSKGSATKAGITSYSTNHADVLLWLKNGWIDYVIPQIYWNIGFPVADFETLAKWWNSNSYGKDVYVGHSCYKIDAESKIKAWQNPNQIIQQLQLVNDLPHLKGSSFFNTSTLLSNPLGTTDLIRSLFNRDLSKIAPMAYKEQIAPSPIINFKGRYQQNELVLYWQLAANVEPNFGYCIYRANAKGQEKKLLAIVPGDKNSYHLNTRVLGIDKKQQIIISSFSQTHTEHTYENVLKVQLKKHGLLVK